MKSNGDVKDLKDGEPGERQTTITITNNECSALLRCIDYYLQRHDENKADAEFRELGDLHSQIDEIKHVINADK
jgi:hypothetical protein